MGQGTKFVTVIMPRTEWREPLRANDDLLQLPKGRPLTPTEEIHEYMAVEEALRARPVERAVLDGEMPLLTAVEMSRAQGIKTLEYKQGGASSEAGSETAGSNVDDTAEGSEEYDGDAESGPEAIADTSSTISEEEATIVPDANYDFADDELLIGEERDTDEEYTSSPTTSSPPTSISTDPRPVQAGKHRAKVLRQGTERIRPHPIDATKVIVTYEVTDPAGKLYDQETEVPDVVPAPANVSSGSGSIILPDLEASKVPRARKNSPWTRVPGTSGYEWTRGDGDMKETWRINVFFRRLDRDTHAYQDIYVNTNLLANVDPNDKRFRTSYNKWVLQIARRRDVSYTQKVVRVHWNTAERRALYSAINTFCSEFGIHRFGFSAACTLTTAQLQSIADTVNAAPNPARTGPRGVDAVRGQIVSAHNKARPKNEAIFELLAKGAELRARMAGGEAVPRAERKPGVAIPLSLFPVGPVVAVVARLSPGGGKRKRSVVVEEEAESSSEELSDPAASEGGRDEGDEARDGWMATGELGEDRLGESGEGNWLVTSEEMVSGEEDDRAEARDVSSPAVKKARVG